MSRVRLSIAGMMATLVVFALGFAALSNATELWAYLVIMCALALLGIVVLGALPRMDDGRALCVGAIVFGGGYALVAFGMNDVRVVNQTAGFLARLEPVIKPSPFFYTVSHSAGTVLSTHQTRREAQEFADLLLKLDPPQSEEPLYSVFPKDGEGPLAVGLTKEMADAVTAKLNARSPVLTASRGFVDVSSLQIDTHQSDHDPELTENFVRIGQSLIAVVLGLAGAGLAWPINGRKTPRNHASMSAPI